MPENYVNVLFSKGLLLDDIIKLLNIKKISMQKPNSKFLNVIGNKKQIRVIPLYVLTDYNGKDYFI